MKPLAVPLLLNTLGTMTLVGGLLPGVLAINRLLLARHITSRKQQEKGLLGATQPQSLGQPRARDLREKRQQEATQIGSHQTTDQELKE